MKYDGCNRRTLHDTSPEYDALTDFPFAFEFLT